MGFPTYLGKLQCWLSGLSGSGNLFSVCEAARATVLSLEQNIQGLEESQEREYQRLDEYGKRAVQRFVDAENPTALADMIEDNPKTLNDQLGELYDVSKDKIELTVDLEAARLRQFEAELALNDFAHKTLLECKLLHPEPLQLRPHESGQLMQVKPMERMLSRIHSKSETTCMQRRRV